MSSSTNQAGQAAQQPAGRTYCGPVLARLRMDRGCRAGEGRGREGRSRRRGGVVGRREGGCRGADQLSARGSGHKEDAPLL